ncbi:MAG: cytochrome c biogenesis protein CcsA [Chitinophagaceae bacterium]|nr:cytochrome c biogenesis protein CcsA [Chitinophagaceae bacterium]
MEYIGEHLIYGTIGHFLTLLSLVASLVATISFFYANKQKEVSLASNWLKIARSSFFIQAVSIFIIFGLLLFLIANHYHEYFFAWNHSSRTLEKQYLLSCIWEDQSGSFLLWSIWNSVLGWIFIWKNKKYEAPVLTVISFAQFCIATMIIGIYIFEQKIGNNPFALLRNELDAPVLFQKPDYLNFPKIYEGNDLNVLLQNYWMVIHPPVLFLGFASTIIPFGFAYAGLINKDHDWAKSALPWTSFSAAVLGLGIMMGAAWAYESLSFGGYWAWDPVENASLVPWITLVAGLHTNVIYKNTGYSLRATYFFYIISFTLILYSTFLTRSGILGDTSVHAFTGADMTLQLLLFVLVFFLPLMFLYFKRYKSIPSIQKEEATYSREFWMFIGSLVLFLSAAIIIAKTSTPVYNKIFGTNIAPPEEPEFAHNQIQIFVAIIIGLLTGFAQYLKYKNTDSKAFYKKIAWPLVISLVISFCISYFGDINYYKFGIGFLTAIHLAIFSSVYTVIANAAYIYVGLNGKLKSAGASIAHVGFGLVLVGVLISSSKKTVLSWNTTGIAVFKKNKQEDPAENITLFKGVRTDMARSNYHVTYEKNYLDPLGKQKIFDIKFEDKKSKEVFYLHPNALKANKGQDGYSFNPDKKHYWNKDIFIYISSFIENTIDDSAKFVNQEITLGDTIFYGNGRMVLKDVVRDIATIKKVEPKADAGLLLKIDVISKEGNRYEMNPKVALIGTTPIMIPDTLIAQSLVVNFNKLIDPEKNKFEIAVKESKQVTELVTLKVYEFPMINILWMGIVIMVIGFLMSMKQRFN